MIYFNKTHLFIKIACVYFISILIGVIHGGIASKIFDDFYGFLSAISTALFFTYPILSICFASIWHTLEKKHENTPVFRLWNIFFADFYASACLRLIVSITDKTSVFADKHDMIVYYTVMLIETLLIYWFEPYFETFLTNGNIQKKIKLFLQKVFHIFCWWSFIVMILTLLPLDFKNILLKIISIPIFAISAPVAQFVGYRFDIITTMFVIYILYNLTYNSISSIPQLIPEDD